MKRLSSVLLSVLCAMSSAVAQELPAVEVRRVAVAGGGAELRYAVQVPPGWQADKWAPMAVVFAWSVSDEAARAAIANLGPELPRAGFVVVCPVREEGKERDLAPLFAALRRGFRIEQGGLHALLRGGGLDTLLTHLHEFQTVSFMGPIDGPEFEMVRRVPARRVRFVGTEGAELAQRLIALHAEREPAGAAADVARTLDEFHDAAANGDAARYFALLPDDAVFLGTDGTERWTGAEFRTAFAKHFNGVSAWTYVALRRQVTVSADGAFAWFDETLDNAAYGECRGSGVLCKRDGRWVVLQYNLTVLVPNDLARGIAARIRAFQDGVQQPVTTVLFVRHGEKADDSRDSELSDAGRARAAALATALRDVKIRKVLTSEFVRTKTTVAPICEAMKLTPLVIAAADGKALVRELRALPNGSTALVCGHSNTIPEVLKALGVAPPITIGDDEFDHLFAVTLAPEGARCLALRYR